MYRGTFTWLFLKAKGLKYSIDSYEISLFKFEGNVDDRTGNYFVFGTDTDDTEKRYHINH